MKNEKAMKELIEKLRKYNAWRRGDEAVPQPSPQDVGEMIDQTIEVLSVFDGFLDWGGRLQANTKPQYFNLPGKFYLGRSVIKASRRVGPFNLPYYMVEYSDGDKKHCPVPVFEKSFIELTPEELDLLSSNDIITTGNDT